MDNDHVDPLFRPILAQVRRIEFLQDDRDEAREALRNIVRIARLYPEALLPTALTAAILVGAKVVGE